MFGFLNLDKPKGITSYDCIRKLKKISGFKKIGHGGTLDPFATGVLPISFGSASRLLEFLEEGKGYIADLKFGFVSSTLDSEGEIEIYSSSRPTKEQFLDALNSFKGKITQTPPLYSAISVNGKRLYEYAREGNIEVEIPKREVEIKNIELLSFDNDCAKIRVHCSPGTYIRTLGADLGLKLGCGAYLYELQRIKSGPFEIENSIELDKINEINLIDPLSVLKYKKYELNEEEIKRIKNGNFIEAEGFEEKEIILLCAFNKLLSVGKYNNKKIETLKVLS